MFNSGLRSATVRTIAALISSLFDECSRTLLQRPSLIQRLSRLCVKSFSATALRSSSRYASVRKYTRGRLSNLESSASHGQRSSFFQHAYLQCQPVLRDSLHSPLGIDIAAYEGMHVHCHVHTSTCCLVLLQNCLSVHLRSSRTEDKEQADVLVSETSD